MPSQARLQRRAGEIFSSKAADAGLLRFSRVTGFCRIRAKMLCVPDASYIFFTMSLNFVLI